MKKLFRGNNAIKAWSAVYLLLLFTLVLPLLNVLTISFIMIPAVILYVKLDKTSFILYYAGIHAIILLVISLLFGNLLLGTLPIMMSLFFLAPAMVIGHLYRKKTAARTVLTAGVLTLLGELLLCLVILAGFGANFNEAFAQSIRDSLALMPQLSDLASGDINKLIQLTLQMLPLFLIAFSLYYIIITHAISRKILNKQGEGLPGLGPIKDWRLPKAFVWCYFIAMILSLFTDPEIDSGLFVILLNLLPLLTFALAIQAVSFLFFLADAKRWNKTLPVVGIIMCFFMSNVLSILGIIDLVFDIRKRFKPQ
ncbi:MAG TPA: DUF2232 domain-containing protein [Bacilli bacterium]